MIKHIQPNPDKIPGFYLPNPNECRGIAVQNNDANYQYFENVLDPNTINDLLEIFYNADACEEVSICGMKDLSIGIGSKRTTMWSEELSDSFNKTFGNLIPKHKLTNKYTRTDCWQDIPDYGANNVWNFEGFSPMFRFMKYVDGGEHYAHYDAAYIYDDPTYRTLSSVVIYLTTNNSGATRFINDDQWELEQRDRDNSDWTRRANEDEVYKTFYPVMGSILVFDHRICHDVSQFIPKNEHDQRIIIRTDLIYKLIS